MRMADTLFLDFEGEGPKGPDRVPQLPFLAGLYRPKARGRKSQFSVSLFREHCAPVKNGIPEILEITTLGAFVTRITTQAETQGLTVCYWSHHELEIVRHFLPTKVAERFETVSLNVKPMADRHLNRLGRKIADIEDKAMNAYLSAISPKTTPVTATSVGAAESCRRLERYSIKEKKWSKWSVAQKGVAAELVRYNREDCVASHKILRAIAVRDHSAE
ncbi:MAG: hypothetical protein O2936_13350 [Proteobacteria bacterium]|nr:hypothetical protein [Pseudomonadota bacterium]